ncbi:MAG: hypothetical protein KF760_28730 [Candidatus Eremiobacteraeota bacterium]|nr:hypothetical protein [Candidatus Eremiobacteraeota bacterium]MCW5865882.1 hypothetical protein [Candidatus Eremiobacteraeota bacterium]
MGLTSETEAATGAADEQNQTTVTLTSFVDDLAQLATTKQANLSQEVEAANQKLQALESFLHNMDNALAAGFTTLQHAAAAMGTRVDLLHGSLKEGLDANDKAIHDLVPQVQAILNEVDKSVTSVESEMKALVNTNRQLVEHTQSAADQATKHAEGMLATVTSELEHLRGQAAELDVDWQGLSAQMDTQMVNLQSQFASAGDSTQKALQSLLENLHHGSQQADQKVRQAFLADTLDTFEKLSNELDAALAHLKELGKRPLELSETMDGVSAKLTETVSQPLALITAIHKKADQTYNLFTFQYK